MTTRSKQWYTKTSRLSNSFANNSIGCLLCFVSATKSSARRPVESIGRGWGRKKGSKGFQRERNRRFRSLWATARSGDAPEGTTKPNQNFKYFWLGLRAKPEKIIVDVQAASPSSWKTPCM